MSASTLSSSPPTAPSVKYHAPLGTRWDKEKAAAGGSAAFDLPTDPKNIGPWILGECVGKGASGRVKIARHCHTGQLAAVKILPIAPLASSRASIIDPTKAEKQRLGIDREVAMMKLMNHPNIMRIYDVFEGERELFLVLEYIEGGELFDFLVNRGRLPPSEALIYFKQIIYGLNYAHTFSIIHRDLKPENILIASLSPPLVKIADWGMAAFAPPHLELETSCGSPHYASPEIVKGDKYSGNATDIWSCGVILFALITGRLPFDDKNVRTLLGKVKLGKYEMPAWVDPMAKDLIQRMLVVDVSRRATIPEILAHPWLRSAEITLTINSSSPTVRQNPSLPPSPSTLAQPVHSNAIDPELFASLRVIWGRHADAGGEIIKRDLCSPQGEGIHAKTFYFLLMQYRDETRRTRSDPPSSTWREVTRSHGPPALESMNFDRDWKLMDVSSELGNKINVDSPRRSQVPSRPLTGARPQPQPLTLVSPRASRIASDRLREKPPSPVGPRAPSLPGTHRSAFRVDASSNISDVPRPYSGYSVVRRKSTPSPSTSPTLGSGPGQSRGTSRQAPKRGLTYHSNNSRGDGRLDLQILTRRQGPTPHQSRLREENEDLSFHQASHVVMPSHSPRRSSRLVPLPPAPLLSLDLDVKPAKSIDEITDVASFSAIQSLVPNDIPPAPTVTVSHEDVIPVLATPREANEDLVSRRMTRAHGRRIASRADVQNKENSAVDGAKAAERTTIGLGVGRGIVGREMSNVVRIGEVPEHKKKGSREVRARSQTVDNLPLKHKRSTLSGLASPIILSPPAVSSKPTTPVVVGEFKGWFSNLFGRSANYGCIYSPVDISEARNVIESVLRGKNVVVEPTIFGDQIILRCSIDQTGLDRHTSLSMKPVRFRIELLSARPNTLPTSASVGSVSLRPLDSPFQTPSIGQAPSLGVNVSSSKSSHPISAPVGNVRSTPMEFPPGTSSVVVMIKDKGSSTSFNLLWQDIKDNLGNITVSDPSCKSPTTPHTPLLERQSFMII